MSVGYNKLGGFNLEHMWDTYFSSQSLWTTP